MIDEALHHLGIICTCESLGTLTKISRTCPHHDQVAARAKAKELSIEVNFRRSTMNSLMNLATALIRNDPVQTETNEQLKKEWYVAYITPVETAITVLLTIADRAP